MREIKFRVWDKHTKTFIYFGGKFWFDDSENTITFQCTPVLGEKNPTGGRFIFQQFTGLKDKNGKPIFEGDIIKCANEIGIVKWEGANFQVNWCPISTYATYLFLCAKNLEIIGNVWENPELLTN